MKITLFFPPQWAPNMPHLALPTLTAFLRAKGISVQQRDLNIELYDHLLSRQMIEASIERIRRGAGPKLSSVTGQWPRPDQEMVQWALTEGPVLAKRVENAKAVMRGPAFYNGPASLEAFLVLVQCLQIASLPYHPARVEFTSFYPASPEDGSKSLLQSVRDARINPFLDFFKKHVMPGLQHEAPDIIGISIPTLSQMLGGMTLGHLIKQSGLHSHIVIGGPHVTMLREQFPKVPQIFQCFDSAVIGDGQVPLLRLAEAIEEKRDLSSVPNLVYRDPATGKVHANANVSQPARKQVTEKECDDKEAFDNLPDFDGLPLDLYLTPERVLPLLTSHGCYHGKCAFCNVGYGWSNSYRQLRAEHVVDQMLALQQKYGTRHIFFADEAITPRNLRHISALLEAKGTPIHWCGCVRFDRPLSGDLLKAMARGGCRMLMFGLETAAGPMIEHMVKGTQLEHMSRILRESAEAGIWNHTFFFFGFPGETIEQAQETVNFLYAHQQWVHSASPGTFVLERYSPAHLDPKHYGVKKINYDTERDLAIYFDYQVSSGMDDRMADLLVSHLLDALPTKRFGQYYMHDTYKLLYSSYLHDQDKLFPPWLVPEQAETLH